MVWARNMLSRNDTCLEVCNKLTDEEFYRKFELPRDTFEFLILLLNRDLRGRCNGQPSVTPRKQLMAVLRLWGSEPVPFRVVAEEFDLGLSTICRMANVIPKKLSKYIPIFRMWPDNQLEFAADDEWCGEEATTATPKGGRNRRIDSTLPRRYLVIVERSFRRWALQQEVDKSAERSLLSELLDFESIPNTTNESDRFADIKKAVQEVRALYDSLAQCSSWAPKDVLLLVKNYIDNEDDFSKCRSTKRPEIWEKIAVELRKSGVNVTPKMCSRQLSSLKTSFVTRKCRTMTIWRNGDLEEEDKDLLLKYLDHIVYRTPLLLEKPASYLGDHSYIGGVNESSCGDPALEGESSCADPAPEGTPTEDGVLEERSPEGKSGDENPGLELTVQPGPLGLAIASSSEESECEGGRVGDSSLTLELVKSLLEKIKKKGQKALEKRQPIVIEENNYEIVFQDADEHEDFTYAEDVGLSLTGDAFEPNVEEVETQPAVEEEEEALSDKRYRWSDEASQYFFQLLLNHKRDLEKASKVVRCRIWNEIHRQLVQAGFNLSRKQCKIKFAKLKANYRAMKKNGQGRRWALFDIAEAILTPSPATPESRAVGGKYPSTRWKVRDKGVKTPLKRWTYRETVALIEVAKKHYSRFSDPDEWKLRWEIWEEIVDELSQRGIKSNWRQCSEKFKKMRLGYLAKKEDDRMDFEFFELMDEIFRDSNEVKEITPYESTFKTTNDRVKWSYPTVVALVEALMARGIPFSDPKGSTPKSLWNAVARDLQVKGHQVTGKICEKKVNKLKERYKSTNEDQQAERPWDFFEIMDSWYKQPEKEGEHWSPELDDDDGMREGDPLQDVPPVEELSEIDLLKKDVLGPNGKPSLVAVMRKRLSQSAEHEKAKRQRHEEKIEIDRQLLQALTCLVRRTQ